MACCYIWSKEDDLGTNVSSRYERQERRHGSLHDPNDFFGTDVEKKPEGAGFLGLAVILPVTFSGVFLSATYFWVIFSKISVL